MSRCVRKNPSPSKDYLVNKVLLSEYYMVRPGTMENNIKV